MAIIPMDNQPITATFFGQGKWLTEFITPEDLEVKTLTEKITKEMIELVPKIGACHQWVAGQVQYKQFISGKLIIEGKVSEQDDLWQDPGMVIRTKVGNCSNKAFLMASMARNFMQPTDVHVVLGNLYNGRPGGHAWVQVNVDGRDYIVETTRADVPPMVPAGSAERYEAVHFFNDQEAYAVEGKTVLEPFSNFYSTWLKEYLDWAYIKGGKR